MSLLKIFRDVSSILLIKNHIYLYSGAALEGRVLSLLGHAVPNYMELSIRETASHTE